MRVRLLWHNVCYCQCLNDLDASSSPVVGHRWSGVATRGLACAATTRSHLGKVLRKVREYPRHLGYSRESSLDGEHEERAALGSCSRHLLADLAQERGQRGRTTD